MLLPLIRHMALFYCLDFPGLKEFVGSQSCSWKLTAPASPATGAASSLAPPARDEIRFLWNNRRISSFTTSYPEIIIFKISWAVSQWHVISNIPYETSGKLSTHSKECKEDKRSWAKFKSHSLCWISPITLPQSGKLCSDSAIIPKTQIIAVFEPKTQTSRRNVFQQEFPPGV